MTAAGAAAGFAATSHAAQRREGTRTRESGSISSTCSCTAAEEAAGDSHYCYIQENR